MRKKTDETPEENTEEKSEEKSEEENKPKFKIVKRSSALKGESVAHGMKLPSEEITKAQLEFIKEMEKKELEKQEKEAALNAIESFIYDKKDKLYEEGGFSETATDEEKEQIQTALTGAEDWLWDVEEPTAKIYNEKLSELEKLTSKWLNRAKELKDRPKILKSFEEQFNATKHIVADVKKNNEKMPEDDKPLTDKEIETLEKKYQDAMNWKNETLAKQNELKDTDEPIMTYEKCFKKSEELRREVDYVIRKIKSFRPKPKKKEEEKKEDKAEDKTGDKSEEKKSEDTEKSDEKTTDAPKEDEVTHDSAEL